MDGFPIFIFIFLAVAGSTIAGLTKARRVAGLQKAADELGLQVGKKGISGEINGYMVDTEYVSRGDKKGTRFRVRYPGWLGFNLRVATDQLGELRKIPLLGNLMPAQDIEIGSDDVDRKHLIQGDTYQVTGWFNARRRDMIARASKRFSSIEVTDRQVEAYVGRTISDPGELSRMTRAVLFMAEVAYRTEDEEGIPQSTVGADPFDRAVSEPTARVPADDELVEVTIVDMRPDPEPESPQRETDGSVFADVFEDDPIPGPTEAPGIGIPNEGAPTDSGAPIPAPTDASLPPFESVVDEFLHPGPEPGELPSDIPPGEVGSESAPVVTPPPADSPTPTASVATLSESLFAEYNPAYRIEELFSEGPKGSMVTWTGKLENVGEFRRDRYLGEGPGIEIELTGSTLEDGRVTEVFVALPQSTDIEDLRSGTEVTVRGKLTALDAIMRRFYLTDAEIIAAGS